MSLPSYASDLLVVRTGQLTTGDFHPIRLAALSAAPPSLLDHPMNARHGQMPRQACHCLALCDGNGPAAFRQVSTLGTWDSSDFRGRLTAARTLAYLRIAVPVTRDAARLASGLLGSALTEWVLHPRDGSPNFKSEQSLLLSHRTSIDWTQLTVSQVKISAVKK